jgi:phosphatidylglycerol:prolipoprotein diacylglycerol transferase
METLSQPPPSAHWTHDLSPFLWEFGDNFGIRYYGLAYALGVLAAGLLLTRYGRRGRSLVPPEGAWDFVIALIAGIVVGARLGFYIFYRPGLLLTDPLSALQIWKEGGMSAHGGFFGALAACAGYARWRRVPVAHLLDLTVTLAPAGVFFGRVANFINGELWGKVSAAPWAVIFPDAGDAPGVARHPSQLYEAALEGLALFAFMQLRFWRTDWIWRQPGRLCGEFLLAYAAARGACECFREPDAGVALIFGLHRGVFYSVFFAAAGLWLMLRKGAKPLTPPGTPGA